MVIYGWIRPTILLALKNDLCATCSVAGQHAIVRRVTWVDIFWVPVVPIWLQHRLVCGNCGAETKLGFRQVRAALKTGKLPLPPRPGYAVYAQALYDANERRPAEVEFDPIERNPTRSRWHAYTWVWTIGAGVVVVLLVLGALLPRSQPVPVAAPVGTSPGAAVPVGASPGAAVPVGASPGASPSPGLSHECWLGDDGSINGCRLHDGSKVGFLAGTPTLCYFMEPLPTGEYTVRCRD